MAGLKKTVQKVHSVPSFKERFLQNPFTEKGMKKGFHNPLNVITEGAGDIGEAFTPEIPEPEEQTIIPIPTASTAETQARKRRARSKSSGRSSTILTEGLGG